MSSSIMSSPSSTPFKVQLRHPDAKVPTRADDGCAGYDLSSVENLIILPNTHRMVETGISLQFPKDCYGRIAPRSGLAAKHAVDVLAGVVDSSFRGTLKVILMNNGPNEFIVKSGDRIAQLIFEKIYTPAELEVVTTLDDSTRGEKGFGSTGM